jgi:23S rRNA (cytosine1962-C5)-methyltransferase
MRVDTMNETLPTVLLRRGESDRIAAGHPWIYEANIQRVTSDEIENGDLVQVRDARRRRLGYGFFNSHSKIRVRMVSRERVTIDTAFFKQRIETALDWRRRRMPEATSFRAVNSESDFLSGLIVDKYEDCLTVQMSSLSMDQRKPMILEALQEIFQPAAIYERSDVPSRKHEGLEEHVGTLAGEFPDTIDVKLNGLTFRSDVKSGQKTGMYLDQQANYRHVADLASGARVLDCFCCQGGFAIHAAKAGATAVTGIDMSESAVAQAATNASLNGVGYACTWETANVFDWLKAKSSDKDAATRPEFDLIVLDPPTFTRNRANIGQAYRGYREIQLRALKLLRPGGVLATFSCSHHVDAQTFLASLMEASVDARRTVRQVATYTQSPDHPIVLTIPESEYLKGFAFEAM